jgi:hypothetical protein
MSERYAWVDGVKPTAIPGVFLHDGVNRPPKEWPPAPWWEPLTHMHPGPNHTPRPKAPLGKIRRPVERPEDV